MFRPSFGRRDGFSLTTPKMGNFNRARQANSFAFRTCTWMQKLPATLLSLEYSNHFKSTLRKVDILKVISLSDVK
ncbi:hypothetical protein Y032_0715g1781 [Ancylostoma ceylanicum]|uniref:Uncharacterized protein n=1 Tax=Ancylostoma ceylanicum TaxID=53326 RepID=A0A016WFR4_9BILA|nr:hypothetical protein Y032_0715g1781 [Ancylostoma ceylanicum]